MRLAQITDLHVKAERRPAYGRVDTAAALEATVAATRSPLSRISLVAARTGEEVTRQALQAWMYRWAVESAAYS